MKKKNLKRIATLTAVSIAAFSLTACGNSKTASSDAANASNEEASDQLVIGTLDLVNGDLIAQYEDWYTTELGVDVKIIKFDSGLIDLPFVQATDVYDRNGHPYTFYDEQGNLIENVDEYNGNDVYIWTNWKTGEYDLYGEGGSVFMDFRNSLSDQNLIIYGHHFARDWDPSGSKQFTPLDALLEEENYEANKTLKLILNNEIREYVITNVFTIDIDNEYELNVMRKNMNEDYSGNANPGFFNGFIEYIDGINKYPISEELNDGDNILTLVTCIQHQPELRQIIICKETHTEQYDG